MALQRKYYNIGSLRRMHLWVIIIAFIAIGLLSGFAGSWLQNKGSNSSISSVNQQKQIVNSQSELISGIAKSVGPSVVSINVDINTTSDTATPFGVLQQPSVEQAAGTGIIISSSGVVVTNRHVVPSGTSKVSVTLSDGTELKNVSVIGRTSDSDNLDIAFLKINDAQGHKFKAAALGDSSKVQVGGYVVAIGNALGQFQNTVTSGIISGFGRSVLAGDSSGNPNSTESLTDLFQTDAAINEGNSGGPLTNLNGQVIGINTAIAGNAQNIGFAIPINDVKGIVHQVVKTGQLVRPYLGVRYTPVTKDIADQYNLKSANGAFIVPTSDPNDPSVAPGSAAAAAGLQDKDVIVAVNGTKVDPQHTLTALLGQHQPGEKIILSIQRGNKSLHVNVTLGTLPTN